MNAHDNLLRCTELENSAAEVRLVETELKEFRDAPCEAVARLEKTDNKLHRSLFAETEVSQKVVQPRSSN